MGNSLDHFWPTAPYLAWLLIFLVGTSMMSALPLWGLWQLVVYVRGFRRATRHVWAERDQLELSAIANLSVGRFVSDPYDVEPQLSRHRSLKDAVKSGALRTVDMAGSKPNIMTLVTREDLRAYANSSKHPELLGLLAKWDKLNSPKSLLKDVKKSPSPLITDKKRDTPVHLALGYIQTRDWNIGFNDSIQNDKTRLPKHVSFQEMRQSALDGDMRIWGRASLNGPHVLIPTKYWKIWQIDFFSVLRGENATEIAEVGYKGGQKFHDLMVSKAEVEAKWPAED